MAETSSSSFKITKRSAHSTLRMPLSRCGRRRGSSSVSGDSGLLNTLSKVQRTFLHDRHVSSKYDVLENLLSEHPGDGFISASRKLLLGVPCRICHARHVSLISTHRFQYENDNDIGVAVIDSFTHHILQFMEGINKTSHASMQDLVRVSALRLPRRALAHQL